MTELELFEAAVDEYPGVVTSSVVKSTKNADMDALVKHLSLTHDWTKGGARVIVTLANEYGAFVLRNALALAIALGKEDGDRGI